MPEQEISREDSELIDKIIDVIDINKEGTVDIPRLKNDCLNCCEGGRLDDVKAILNEMTNDIDWNDFVDALKLGLIHKAQGENSVFNREQVEISKDEEERREQTQQAKVHRLDTKNDPMPKEVRRGLMKMFNRMDPDGDGYVTLEEFQAYMMENRSALGSKKIGLKTKITLF